MAFLNCNELSFSYDSTSIIKRQNFSIEKGEIACLMGASGCGKSTFLRLIAGLITPSNGRISCSDIIWFHQLQKIKPNKRQIGFVFQDPTLLPHLTVKENITLGFNSITLEDERYIQSITKMLQINELESRNPSQLSGGQQQRVSIARALSKKPQLLLMDEPFANLDHSLRGRLCKDVKTLLKALQTTALVVTHCPEDADKMADVQYELADAKIHLKK